jgi:hypothetical protein
VLKSDTAGPEKMDGQLLTLRLERWDDLQFSGLLGLRVEAAGLYYVLLDATGIKLLEAEVTVDGRSDAGRLSGPLKNSSLGPFLAEALARIYLQEPVQMPCAGSWQYRLCREESGEQGLRKYGQAGMFRVWEVSARQTPGAGLDAVVYRQPWLGLKLMLDRPDSGK